MIKTKATLLRGGYRNPLWIGVIALLLLSLMNATLSARGGVSGTGGRLIGFSSIIVNGRLFKTQAADIQINGQPALESELKLGATLYVEAPIGSQDASSVSYFDQIAGVIENVQLTANLLKLSILGQTVEVNLETVVHGGTSGLLQAGTEIAASGLHRPDGALVATHVELRPLNQLQIIGTVSDLGSTSFQVNDLTVDFSQALLDGALQPLSEGDWVRVITAPANYDGEVMFANEVLAQTIGTSLLTDLSIEGIISARLSPNEFVVDDQLVRVDEQTIGYPDPALLQPGDAVISSGQLTRTGTLLAQSISLLAQASEEVIGVITDIEADDGDLEISVNGEDFDLDGFIIFEDASTVADRDFGADDLSVGTPVRLAVAREEEDGNDDDDDVQVRRLTRLD